MTTIPKPLFDGPFEGSARAADEAGQLLGSGFQAIKLRLGYPELKTDLEVVRARRRA